MKKSSHYTDEDFQSYFDNNFTGDESSLENHLHECELCSKNFKAYSLVWSFAKKDLQTESLSIDLANLVANKVFTVKEGKPLFEKVMYGVLICLGCVGLLLCLNYLISLAIPAPFILLIIPFGLYLLLTFKEIKIINQRFALH